MDESRGVALIYAPEGVDSATRFAGRSLDQRAVALARSAGLEPRLVGRAPAGRGGNAAAVAAGDAPLAPGARLPVRAAANLPVVLWRLDVAWAPGALRELLARPEPARLAVRDDLGRVALLRLPAARLGGIVPASLDLAAAGAALAGDAGSLAGHRLIALDPGAGAPHGTPVDRAEAELVRSLANPRDGLFDRLLNRHLSWRLTPPLLRLPVTPNRVTALSLAVGILAACGLAAPGLFWPVVGGLLLQLTAVLDCIDGEIARVKAMETEWGEWFDITTDTVIHVLVFLGMAVHAWPELGRETAWMLGALFALGGFASFAVVTRAERTEDRWKGIDAWQARLLAQLLDTLTNRDLSVLVLAATAAGMQRQLLTGAAFGAHVFWLTALLLHRAAMRRAGADAVSAATSITQPRSVSR